MRRDGSRTTSRAHSDALAAEFAEVYPRVVGQLVELFLRVEAIDKEVSRVNGAAPYGEHRRLREVELTARGVDKLMQPDVVIAKELRLPVLTRRPSEPVLAWPPPTPSWQTEYFKQMVVRPHPGTHWHEQAAERARALGESSQQALAHAAEMTRQHEERENEASKQRAREALEATRRAAGWPT